MKTQHLSWPTFAELAEHHLGSDFFSLAEIENAYECSYTPAQKDIMTASAPTTLMLLFAQRHRCTLMPTPPVEYNLFEFYALSQAEVGPEEECWFQSEFLSFSHNELLPACRWLMVGKHPRLFSPQKTWSDQKELVTRFEYIPPVVEVVYAITTLHKLRGVRCLDKVALRTSSIDLCGQHITVGDIHINGFDVNGCWDAYSKQRIGLASAVKSSLEK